VVSTKGFGRRVSLAELALKVEMSVGLEEIELHQNKTQEWELRAGGDNDFNSMGWWK
jgi:hypothetical protein